MLVCFLHERMLQLRREKKLTQETLAELCGCSVRYLRDLERGVKYNPSAALVRKLAYVLEVPMEELLQLNTEGAAFCQKTRSHLFAAQTAQ